MPKYERASGIAIELPDDISIEETGAAAPKARGRGTPLPKGPVPLPGRRPAPLDEDPVIGAMLAQDLALVDSFVLSPEPSARSPTRRAPARLVIDVDESEDSAMLFEQDGVYSWRYSERVEPVGERERRRGPVRMRPQRRITFDLSVDPSPDAVGRRTRGPIADFVLDKVRVYVFRFVAHIAVSAVIEFLERKKRTGLVHIAGDDPSQWAAVEGLDVLPMPSDRPARILLLVHGTFSSTVGSFGALGVTPWGRAFLVRARARYDAVIGYDHRTLSADPLQNAEDLLGRLERTTAPALEIDAVAFSRGGLVLRSFIEYLLPAGSLRARVHRAVFVGATNAGTELAAQENWARLIDLTTNLVAVGSRALALFAPAALAALIVRESVETLGALVKGLATHALAEEAVPGLAAMVPTGRFVTEINKAQAGQPTAAESIYYAVSSDFDMGRVLDGNGAPEFPARLARWAVDAIADATMRGPNDLVVDTASVTAIDAESGVFIKDHLDFGRNPHVYHTIYFAREEVTGALTKWLGLGESGRVASAIPAGADDRIVVVGADEPLSVALATIRATSPTYVVVRRDTPWGERYHYAYRREELLELSARIGHGAASRPLEDVVRATPLEMHEGTSTPESTLESLETIGLRSGPAGQRVILREGGVLRAVLERGAGVAATAAHAPARPTRRSGQTTRAPAPAPARRVRGARAGRSTGALMLPPESEAARGTVFILGHVPELIPLNVVVPLSVVVSQQEITVTAGPTRAAARASVALDRTILVQVIPKRNLAVEGDDRAEVDPKAPRTDLVFDVKGAAPGDGEMWILLRQGPVTLATLTLRPQVVAGLAAPSGARVRSAVDAEPADLETRSYPVLQIFEQQNGGVFRYHFVLHLGPSEYYSGYSDDIKRPRGEYVAQMYKEIEGRWLSSPGDFAAFEEELRAYGGTLLDELVPPNVQDALWNVRDELTAIQVVAEEPFIPWELVHLKAPRAASGKPAPLPEEVHFLAQKGLVRWLHNRGAAPLRLAIRKDHSYYVVPKYPHPQYELPGAQAEIPFLKKTFGAQEVAPEVVEIRSLLRTPGKVHHFHFSGHGEADTEQGVDAQLVLSGTIEDGHWVPRHLKADYIAQWAQLQGPGGERPLVVLNACQVGRAGWRLSSIGGFAESFIRAGAGVFVGSLWSVGDAPALDFSEGFYGAMVKGKTLSRAATVGREAARKKREGTWLAYVVYGYPHATLTVT